MSTIRHSARADLISHTLEKQSNEVARSPHLSKQEKAARIVELTKKAEGELAAMRAKGEISADQFDGTGVAGSTSRPGGELGEIRRASARAAVLIDKPKPAKRLGAIVYDSHRFDNWTLTGKTSAGAGFHLRLGSHGGDQDVTPGDSAEGFPFTGGKWVEGELIIAGRAYGINNRYPDCMQIKRDAEGAPVAVKIRTRATVRELGCELIDEGNAAWRDRRAERGGEQEVLLEMELPLKARGGDKKLYGALGIGFEDQNYGFELAGGAIAITAVGQGDELAENTERHTIDQGHGAWEVGQFKNIPRAPEAAYRYVGGQHLDLAATLARLDELDPAAVKTLRTQMDAEDTSLAELGALIGDAGASSREMRQRAAELLAIAMRQGAFVTSSERTSTVQFEGKTLNQGIAGRAMSLITLRRMMDEAGSIDSKGNFDSYEKHSLLDPLTRNPQIVEPLAIVSSQDVPLYKEGKQTGLLERRTVILFDHEAGKFGIGFQEVFHDS